MKIAVTAANGQLGSAIVQELKNAIGKENVVGIVRTPAKAKHLDIEIRKGDYNSRDEFNEALKGIDRVLIVSGMDDPKKRIPQHRNIIEAAKQNGLEKIVYTSIVGDDEGTAFSPIVQSNRQTEEDVKASGLNWSIGRNGIYIEPDLEYLEVYKAAGEIKNCAGEGKCTYTSRPELGFAYSRLLLSDQHNGMTFNLVGRAITQAELANYINEVFGTDLVFNSTSVDDYRKERIEQLGDFLGTVIAGIYEGIRKGANDVHSDFERVSERPHKSALEMMEDFKASRS